MRDTHMPVSSLERRYFRGMVVLAVGYFLIDFYRSHLLTVPIAVGLLLVGALGWWWLK